jgi:uncharacterized protein (DUF983 family)
MILSEVIYSASKNKCPRCHKGKVFENNNPYSFRNGLKMKAACSECYLKYEREPGFFYGSMYVSYALMAGILIIWFISDLLWLHSDAISLAMIVVSTMIFFFPIVFRSSRIIWLNFFVRFDENFSTKKREAISAKNNTSKEIFT